jgi:16S rRNA (cytosine1402-N4)-methyltransferase
LLTAAKKGVGGVHRPVLLNEVVEYMEVKRGGFYIDGTVGSGGHAAAVLEQTGGEGMLLGLDQDVEALERADRKLKPFRGSYRLVHGNLADLEQFCKELGVGPADGILFDLGVSSNQLDSPERGFSFQQDGPLDMRMDRSREPSAESLVNDAPVAELERIIRTLGEERQARRIARAIDRERRKERIQTTGRLALIVEKAVGGRRGRIHPATRTFQALRMAVNRELECLDAGLRAGLDRLSASGRMLVISFHSLEDRRVKHFFAEHAGRMVSLQAGGERWEGSLPRVRRVTRKPVVATEEEIAENPRARSAKLRVVERM